MENGTSAVVGLPAPGPGASAGNAASWTSALVGGGAKGAAAPPRKVPAWVTLDSGSGALHWASLEQRQGRPVEEGDIRVAEILAVRNTGVMVELVVLGVLRPYVLDFTGGEEDRLSWCRFIELAMKVLTPEEEKEALEAARAKHRQREIEERRAMNEVRKKRLSQDLGMKYTAEAMVRAAE